MAFVGGGGGAWFGGLTAATLLGGGGGGTEGGGAVGLPLSAGRALCWDSDLSITDDKFRTVPNLAAKLSIWSGLVWGEGDRGLRML